MATSCSAINSIVVPSGTGLEETSPTNGPSFKDSDW